MSRPAVTRVRPALRSPLVGERWAELDLHDTWRIARDPRTSADPEQWATWVFRRPPLWLTATYVVRNLAVRVAGVPPAGRDAFDTQAANDTEVSLGMDDRHLDFRAVVRVEPDTVQLTTYAVTKNRVGTAYLALVKLGHGFVVRSMLRRAVRLAARDERPVARDAPLGHNGATRG